MFFKDIKKKNQQPLDGWNQKGKWEREEGGKYLNLGMFKPTQDAFKRESAQRENIGCTHLRQRCLPGSRLLFHLNPPPQSIKGASGHGQSAFAATGNDDNTSPPPLCRQRRRDFNHGEGRTAPSPPFVSPAPLPPMRLFAKRRGAAHLPFLYSPAAGSCRRTPPTLCSVF